MSPGTPSDTPELFRARDDDHVFRFACTPDRCDMRCCTTGHPLVLNPFEVGRISRASGISFEDLYDEYFERTTDPENGMPLLTINREKGCPFLAGDRRCTVYEARPLVCRLFPLGKLYRDGFRYVLLSENPCAGFEAPDEQTVRGYREAQDTAYYDRMWEIWVEFLNRMETVGIPKEGLCQTVFLLLAYNTDVLPPGLTEEDARTMDEEEILRARLQAARKAAPRLAAICGKPGP